MVDTARELLEQVQVDSMNFAENPAALGDAFRKAVAALRAALTLVDDLNSTSYYAFADELDRRIAEALRGDS